MATPGGTSPEGSLWAGLGLGGETFQQAFPQQKLLVVTPKAMAAGNATSIGANLPKISHDRFFAANPPFSPAKILCNILVIALEELQQSVQATPDFGRRSEAAKSVILFG
jgi:hypothetical protein